MSGEADPCGRSRAANRVDLDPAAERFDRLFGDRQSEAEAGPPLLGRTPVEAVEQPIELLGPDARARVGELDRQRRVGLDPYADPDRPAESVARCVAREIE